MRKIVGGALALVLVFVVANILRPSNMLDAATPLGAFYVLDHLGNIINGGTASAVTVRPNGAINVLNSSNQILDTLGQTLPLASGSGQCLNSVSSGSSNSIWGTCGSGNLPALGSAGSFLLQNAAGNAAAWTLLSGDVAASVSTVGQISVTKIQGNSIKSGAPTNAQVMLWNSTNSDWEPVSISGDATITNAGALTVTKTSGTVFGTAATLGLGTLLSSGGGNINVTSPIPIANGGTNAVDVSTARANLGLGTAATINTPVSVGNGGTGITSGSSGALPYFNTTSTITSSGVLTANTPVIGGGAGGAPASGTRTGNTTNFMTSTGTLTNGNCLSIDPSGNAVDAGAPCGTGGGGGTPGGSSGSIQYNNAGSFGGALLNGLVKANGASAPTAAVSGTDYAPATSGTSILKASSGGFTNAVSGTDYAPATSGSNVLTGNGAGGFSSLAGNTLASHNFANSISTAGVISGAQPNFTDLAGSLASTQLPALTGDTTSSAGSAATTTIQEHPTVVTIADGASPYTVLATDYFIQCNGSTGNITLNLPATSATHHLLTIKNISTSKTCVITPSGADKIDGASNVTLASQNQTTTIFDRISGSWDRESQSALGGDLSGVPSNASVIGVNGVSYGSGPATNTVPVVTGSSTTTYEAVPVAAGGTNLSSGTSGGILGFTGSNTLASSAALGANLPVIGGGAGATPTTGTRSGNTTEFGTVSGAVVSGNCAKWDASGNLVDNGASCGGGGGGSNPIFPHTLTITTGATTNVVNAAGTATWDIDNIPNASNATLTITSLASTGMADGEMILENVIDTGTAPTITHVAGSGVTYASDVLGDTNTAPGQAAACGTPPSIGHAWFRWQWHNGNSETVYTLLACGIDPPSPGLLVSGGGTGLNSGTSGGVPYFNSATSMASSAALTANLPVIGGGAGAAPSVGTRSGNTTEFGSVSGALTSGNLIKSDASGNLIDDAVSLVTGVANQLAFYSGSGAVSGNANATISSGALTLGQNASVLGDLILSGNTSGAVTIKPQAAAGTFNFNLPITAGAMNQPLLSQGGGSSAMTWGSLSGNTSTFATTSGTLISGDCVSIDGNGNFVDNGGACGSGGGSTSQAPDIEIKGSTGGELNSISTSTLYQPFKAPGTMTLVNIVADAQTFSCSVNPTIALVDCGATAGACGSPTTLATVTPTAATMFNGSITSATVTSGHYLAYKFTGGTCTALNLDFAANAQPNSQVAFIPGGTNDLLTSTSTSTLFHPFKANDGATINNFVGNASVFTCSVNPTLSLVDCGASAGACGSPTTLAHVALTSANTQIDGTIDSATITSGHFLAYKFTTAGTCTNLNAEATAGITSSDATYINQLAGDSNGVLQSVSTTAVTSPFKASNGGTVNTFTGNASLFSCSVNPTVKLEDCGAAAGSCGSPTDVATVTLTAVNTQTAGTVTSATVTNGHYYAYKLSAGTCSALAFQASGAVTASVTATPFTTAGTGLTSPSTGVVALSTPVSVANGGSGTTTTPTSGQMLIASGSSSYVPQTIAGDATVSTGGSVTVTKTNGVAFATSATTDTTSATNITSGTLPNARLVAVPNSALANSAITVGSTSTSLGGTLSAATGRSSTGLNIDEMTSHGDSAYTIVATDRVVVTSATFTAPRTWTLPAANAVNSGQSLMIADTFGGINGTNTLTIARAGSDTIQTTGSTTSIIMDRAFQTYTLVSDGTSKWTVKNAITIPLITGGQALSTSAASNFFPVSGFGGITTTASQWFSPIPLSGTVSNLRCFTNATQGSGKSDQFIIDRSASPCTGAPVDSTITCTESNAQTCSDLTHTLSVTAGDCLVYKDVTVGSSITARFGGCSAEMSIP